MFAGGLKVGTVRGIPIRIHVSFLLVLPFLAWAFGRELGVAARLANVEPGQLQGSPFAWGLAVALALFGGVLLHELAHSLYARRTGGQVRAITLMMVGGVSHLSRAPRRARDEAVMALVGPLVSVGLAGLCFALLLLVRPLAFEARFAVFYLGYLNLFLGVFNLLPAFPMDGGRILRSLLSGRIGPVRATRWAAGIGKGFAVLFGLAGLLLGSPLLLVIAFVVWSGAAAEAKGQWIESLLRSMTVRELASPHVRVIAGDERVATLTDRMMREREAVYLVSEGTRIAGIVTLDAVQSVAPSRRGSAHVREIARSVPEVAPDETLDNVAREMEEGGATILPVVQAGRLVGTIDARSIEMALRLRSLSGSRAAERPRRAW